MTPDTSNAAKLTKSRGAEMEVHHEAKLQSSKLGGLLNAQVRKRGTKQLIELPHKQASMVFNPSDPYSSAMDNIPLKDLFPNVKVRKRSQERKVGSSDTPPMSIESQDSIRNKLRESLTAALRTVGGVDFDQSPDQEWKAEIQSDDQYYYADEQARDQLLGAGQVRREDSGAHTVDSVFGIPGRDLDWKYDIQRSGFMGDGSWFPTNRTMYPSRMDESPYKKLKIEAENTEREDLNQLQGSQQAEKVALDIEAELFRHFGGVNRKYKEKARSLLFNLKDRSNPDLRTRVLSGEISPQNLCTMNAEQLASKELSQWRIAKAEEFAHMIVLTDADAEQRRLVKKTHKGEFEVQVEKDDVVAEVATGAVRQGFALGTKQETEENGVEIPADSIFDDELDSIMAEADAEGLEFSPIRDPISIGSMSAADQVFDVNYDWDLDKEDKEIPEVVAEPSLQEEMDKDGRLPAIMSLDEYLGSKKDQELKSAVKAEDVEISSGITGMKMQSFSHLTEMSYPSLTSSKERVPRKPTGSPKPKAPESGNAKNGGLFQKEIKKEHRKYEKLWEGSFQLSGSQISSVLAFYKRLHFTIPCNSYSLEIWVR